MDSALIPLLTRVAEALERLSPPPPIPTDFAAARLWRHDPETHAFLPAPDYPLALDLLVGVDRQRDRFAENLRRFTSGLPFNHALLWGSRGAGKSSLAKAAFMAASDVESCLKLVEVDRDKVTALPALFDTLRERPEFFVVLCDDLSFEEGAVAAKASRSGMPNAESASRSATTEDDVRLSTHTAVKKRKSVDA